MAATVYDIAKAAGVSRTTVLRALWNRDYISPETRDRVLQVARELNYRPNHIARSLVMGKTKFIGVLAGTIDGTNFHRYMWSLHETLRRAGYSMLFHIMSGADPQAEQECVEEMISNHVPGVLAVPSSLNASPEPYRQLLDAGIPVVIMDRPVEGLTAPQIVVDQYYTGHVLTEHLISLGHRRMLHLAMPLTSHLGRERARGFTEAMCEAGLPVDESSIMEVEFEREAGTRAMNDILTWKGRPTAIIARNDWVAAGVMDAALRAGLSVPGDVSITGASDNPLSDMLKAGLTTMHHPTEEMAERAAGLLLDILAGKQVKPEIEAIRGMIIVRESSAPPKPV